MFTSHKKIALLSFLLSAALASPFVEAESEGGAYLPAAAETVTEVAKPIAGRNRRRDSVRLPYSIYPQANKDYLNVSAGSHKARINVLANDTGRLLRLKTVNARSSRGGKVYLKNNRVIYRPPQNYVGKDSFWYTVVDQAGREHSAKVIVCVCDNR